MDIHPWVAVPEAELAQQSQFYLDDFTPQVVEEPPLHFSTAAHSASPERGCGACRVNPIGSIRRSEIPFP
jgi:hypothetical protein